MIGLPSKYQSNTKPFKIKMLKSPSLASMLQNYENKIQEYKTNTEASPKHGSKLKNWKARREGM